MLTLKVEELLDRRGALLDLRLLAGHAGIERQVTAPRVQKQGLVLVGVTDALRPGRIQVLGQTELEFMANMAPDALDRACAALAGSQKTAAVLITKRSAPAPLRSRATRATSIASWGLDRRRERGDLCAPSPRRLTLTPPHQHPRRARRYTRARHLFALGQSGIGKSGHALVIMSRPSLDRR